MSTTRINPKTMIAIGIGILVLGLAMIGLAMSGDGDSTTRASSDNTGATRPTIITQAAEKTEGTQAPAVPQLKIPNGKEALAIQVGHVPGVAGGLEVGDRVNVYGALKGGTNAAPKPGPATRLVVSNVEVLAASNAVAGGNSVVTLAVSPNEAEQIIHLASFEAIYLTLQRDGAPPVNPGSTPGRNTPSIL